MKSEGRFLRRIDLKAKATLDPMAILNKLSDKTWQINCNQLCLSVPYFAALVVSSELIVLILSWPSVEA